MDTLDTSFSYVISISLSSLVPERNKSISLLPTPVSTLYVWPLAHFFQEPMTITPKLSPMDSIFEGSIEVEI
jgi:hypothetical protein